MSTTKINIQQPELWTLQMSLDSKTLDYILYTDAQEDSLIMGSIELDTSAGKYLRQVENAVYDNPFLLDDYKEVRVIYNSPHFVLLPQEYDEIEAQEVFDTHFPDSDGEMAMCSLKRCGVNIAFEIPKGVLGFMQRTFFTPPVFHHLHPLCEHYKRINDGSEIARMFINMSDSHMDMVVYQNGRMVLANSFDYRTPQDAAFFALHTWDSMGMDRLNDEVQLTGDKAQRDAIAPILRKYIGYVMPAIYPAAALRLGQNAMKAPFDLIMLALCES
ncbi:MAG: DUF3822 family protein [Muribaculaceae bacterium]|nr:DUF3822 family protein [Muribaculaceae bacterium]